MEEWHKVQHEYIQTQKWRFGQGDKRLRKRKLEDKVALVSWNPQPQKAQGNVIPDYFYLDNEPNLISTAPHFRKPIRRIIRGPNRSESTLQKMIAIMKENGRLRAEYLLRKRTAARRNEEDECDLFFRSIAKTVKRLCFEERFMVMKDVEDVVFKAELRHAQNNRHREEDN